MNPVVLQVTKYVIASKIQRNIMFTLFSLSFKLKQVNVSMFYLLEGSSLFPCSFKNFLNFNGLVLRCL